MNERIMKRLAALLSATAPFTDVPITKDDSVKYAIRFIAFCLQKWCRCFLYERY